MQHLIFLLLFLTTSLLAFPQSILAADSTDSQTSEKPIGGEAGEKGGIYVAGRAFKTAGTKMESGFTTAGEEMKKGFVKTGQGIKKGGQATGGAFKKAGSEIKGFFTGEKKN